LYNPNGLAPAKLLDTKLTKIISGSAGWSLQVPVGWNAVVGADGATATIPSGHGETFRLSVEANPQNLSVVAWYLAKHPEVKESQILQYRSKRGYQGIIGADLLTTYIPWGDHVFVFAYDLDDQPFINYRTTYAMSLNSLELKGLPQISAPVVGAPLPFEPAATTTGVIAQPVPIDVFPAPATTTDSGSTPPAATASSTDATQVPSAPTPVPETLPPPPPTP